jgi:hypothetical protein
MWSQKLLLLTLPLSRLLLHCLLLRLLLCLLVSMLVLPWLLLKRPVLGLGDQLRGEVLQDVLGPEQVLAEQVLRAMVPMLLRLSMERRLVLLKDHMSLTEGVCSKSSSFRPALYPARWS